MPAHMCKLHLPSIYFARHLSIGLVLPADHRMPSFSTLAFLVLFATLTHALFQSPVTKVKISGSSLKRFPHAYRAPARLTRSNSDLATKLNYVTYVTSIGIGHPATYYTLVVATGTSNTICGINKKYVHTKTTIPTGQQISDTFGSGSFQGLEYLDQVTLAPQLVITNQSIGGATSSSGFEDVQGILGLGPADLSKGTLLSAPDSLIPTVMDNAVSQGLIKHKVFGISFAPSTKEDDTNGVITFGGIDPSAYTGSITYVPITTTPPSSAFWGIDVTSVHYGDGTVITGSIAGIVDSGTTQILFSDSLFSAYKKSIPGVRFDSKSGLLEIPKSSISKMRPLTFDIGGNYFTLDVGAQLVPADENSAWGGERSKRYGVIGLLPDAASGNGVDFILGIAFMERFYTVFDAENTRMGFAYTKHTSSATD